MELSGAEVTHCGGSELRSKDRFTRRGIDEHFFTRKKGFATTLCDLGNHKIYDVVLGRSELSLEVYFQRLEGKSEVKLVCMDLATNCRPLVGHVAFHPQ